MARGRRRTSARRRRVKQGARGKIGAQALYPLEIHDGALQSLLARLDAVVVDALAPLLRHFDLEPPPVGLECRHGRDELALLVLGRVAEEALAATHDVHLARPVTSVRRRLRVAA